MSKPRKTTKAAAKPVTQAEPTVEELKAEVAKFDHDGDGHMGGSLPHAESVEAAEPTAEAEVVVPSDSAWQPPEAEEAAPEEPAAEESAPAPEPAPEPEPEAPAPEAPVTDARSTTVSLGPVECRLRRVSVDTVLGLLGPDGLRRIEAHQTTASFESTCKRLLATDGRATPAVFAAAELAGGQPTILHGYEEIAAAKVCGIPDIPVILVPAGGASEAQSYIVEMVRQQNAQDKPSDDDELFYRVHAEG